MLRDDVIQVDIRKVDDGISVRNDILSCVNTAPVTVLEASRARSPTLSMRFDGCGLVRKEHLISFSRAVRSLGLRGTFFLLPPGSEPATSWQSSEANYFGEWKGETLVPARSLFELVETLSLDGHEVGLHNDCVTLALERRMPIERVLGQTLEALRSTGASIFGSAAHGSRLARMLVFNNREMFSGVHRPGRDPFRTISMGGHSVEMGRISMTDFGLEYEAYEIPRPNRLSESGRTWGGRVGDVRVRRAEMLERFDRNLLMQAVREIDVATKLGSTQMLLHPCHWEIV